MKIKCTFHIAIAFILIQLTDEFSIAFAYGICEKNPYVRILYVTFAILSLLTMIYLYTKYIIRIQMQDLFLGMPLPKKKWCITAVLMPVLICLFYIFFTKGTLEKGNLTYKEIIDVVVVFPCVPEMHIVSSKALVISPKKSDLSTIGMFSS